MNHRRPGEEWKEQDGLLSLAATVLDNDVAAMMLQRGWCRPPQPRRALGRLNKGRQQPFARVSTRRGQRTFVLSEGEQQGDGDEPATTAFRFVPTTAYQIFAHDEVARLRKEGCAIVPATMQVHAEGGWAPHPAAALCLLPLDDACHLRRGQG